MNNIEKKIVHDFYSAWTRSISLYMKWAAHSGIGYPELLVLYALATKGSMTQKAVSDLYGLPKQTINATVRDLKGKGYVTLSAGQKDKREKNVVFTESGDNYAQKMLAPLFAVEQQVSKDIGYERFTRMVETSELFNTLFEREMERKSGE